MVGEKPTVTFKGKELTVRMHDIYFLNEFYLKQGMNTKDFQKLDVSAEPYFDIVIAAREGKRGAAITFLRKMMNNINEWGLYGENSAEFKKQLNGIPLPGAAGFQRTSDHNILVSCGLVGAVTPATEFQQMVTCARAGNQDDAIRLVNLNIIIAEFYAELIRHTPVRH